MRGYPWYECRQDGERTGPVFMRLEQALTQAFSALLPVPGAMYPSTVSIFGGESVGRVGIDGPNTLLEPELLLSVRSWVDEKNFIIELPETPDGENYEIS